MMLTERLVLLAGLVLVVVSMLAVDWRLGILTLGLALIGASIDPAILRRRR